MVNGLSRGALIVAPLRVCSITWPNEVRKWDHSSWLTVAHLRTPEGREAWDKGTADIYLINPEQLNSKEVTRTCSKCKGEGCGHCDNAGAKTTKTPGFVERCIKNRKRLPVDTLIWDELSQAKNHASKRVNALRAHQGKFKQIWGLTGTPAPNSYLDLFAQIRFLDGGKRLGPSVHRYRQAYFESDYMGYKYEIKEGAKEKIDAKIADIALVRMGDDYLDIPTTQSIDIEVKLPAKAMAQYRELEKELLLELEKSDVVALSAATLTMKLIQVTSGAVYGEDRIINVIHDAKVKAIQKLRKQHKNEPILILTMFKHEKARLLEAIDGAVEFHEDLMPKWRAGKIKTMIAQPQQLSHGIDGLQDAGRIAIWSSLTYSNEMYIQTNARLIRTGQSAETIVYRIMAPGTMDDAVAEALREKGDTQTGLLVALKNLQQMREAL